MLYVSQEKEVTSRSPEIAAPRCGDIAEVMTHVDSNSAGGGS